MRGRGEEGVEKELTCAVFTKLRFLISCFSPFQPHVFSPRVSSGSLKGKTVPSPVSSICWLSLSERRCHQDGEGELLLSVVSHSFPPHSLYLLVFIWFNSELGFCVARYLGNQLSGSVTKATKCHCWMSQRCLISTEAIRASENK